MPSQKWFKPCSLNVTDAMSAVDELRDLSTSAEGTGRTLRRERISLLRLTRELVAAGPLGDRPHVRIESSAGAITVETNRAQLNRAMENLLDNAAKYTPPDREIVVRVSAEQIDGKTWQSSRSKIVASAYQSPNFHTCSTATGAEPIPRTFQVRGLDSPACNSSSTARAGPSKPTVLRATAARL